MMDFKNTDKSEKQADAVNSQPETNLTKPKKFTDCSDVVKPKPKEFNDCGDTNKSHSAEHKESIDCGVAEMQFPIAPAIRDHLTKQVAAGAFGGYSGIDQELLELFNRGLKDKYGWEVALDSIAAKIGTVPMINTIVRALSNEGDRVLLSTPIYYHLFYASDWNNRNCIRVPLKLEDNRYYFDWEKIEAEFKQGVKLFMLCNPQNPSGRVWQPDELTKLGELCEKYDVIICSDDLHCDFILNDEVKYTPAASLSPELSRRTITLMSVSKTFNLQTFGATFFITENEQLLETIKRETWGIILNPSYLGIEATRAALRDGDSWHKQLIIDLKHNLAIVHDFFKARLKFKMMWPQDSTYLAWVKSDLPVEQLVEKCAALGLSIYDGNKFEGPGYFRMNFALPEDKLKRALNLLEQVIG